MLSYPELNDIITTEGAPVILYRGMSMIRLDCNMGSTGLEPDNEQVVNHGIGVDELARVYLLRSMQVQGSSRRGASAVLIVAMTIWHINATRLQFCDVTMASQEQRCARLKIDQI